MRCCVNGDADDVPIRDEPGAHCVERGVTLL
ncbi:hypothetical protein SGL43_07460, partial [Streptomyces globisporus]